VSEEQDIVAYKTRRATAQNALRKIAVIVHEDAQTEANKTRYVRKFLRYALVVLLAVGCAVFLLRKF
jgi:cation transport ATPase